MQLITEPCVLWRSALGQRVLRGQVPNLYKPVALVTAVAANKIQKAQICRASGM